MRGHLSEAKAVLIAIAFLVGVTAFAWGVRTLLGIRLTPTLTLIVLAVFVYGLVSGRIKEVRGPGGAGAVLSEAASRPVPAVLIRASVQRAETLPKARLEDMRQDLTAVPDERPLVLTMRIGAGAHHYSMVTLDDVLDLVASVANFPFVVFLDDADRVVAYARPAALKASLHGPGQRPELLDAINEGDELSVRTSALTFTRTLAPTSTTVEALRLMDDLALSAVVVVDCAGRLEGILQREAVVAQSMRAILSAGTA